MDHTLGEQITAKHDRERRIDRRLEIVMWLAQRWQNFRLLQEAALWRQIDQPIPIDEELASRYYRSVEEIFSSLREVENLELVEIFVDSAGKTHAFWINRDRESLAGQFLATLFQ